jgi:hypothetical protein
MIFVIFVHFSQMFKAFPMPVLFINITLKEQ